LSSPQEWLDKDKRSALVTLSQFVLRGETAEIRDDLYRNVIETVLLVGNPDNRFLRISELDEVLRTKVFGISLHASLMSRIVDSLLLALVPKARFCREIGML
jgi:hypothetical protein